MSFGGQGTPRGAALVSSPNRSRDCKAQVILSSECYTSKQRRTPRYTTRWDELPIVKMR
ncbi:DUF4113 domain-containing protein [Marinobacter azerbaijanicus]|uniref:DUF4113 domain-containing protein n=1 Tax=Marinobacter azerbaijanicus TaxID=3050455 RepID=UPI003BF474C7